MYWADVNIWVESFALGTVIGCLGAFGAAISIFSLHKTLVEDKPVSKQIAFLLSLPAFDGGGTLSGARLIPNSDIVEGGGIYLLMIMLTFVLICFPPAAKLYRWHLRQMNVRPHGAPQ